MTDNTVAERLNHARKELEKLSDQDRVEVVRKMPWWLQKKTYRMIARKSSDQKILSILESFKGAAPEDRKAGNYERAETYFIKMLEKYKRI